MPDGIQKYLSHIASTFNLKYMIKIKLLFSRRTVSIIIDIDEIMSTNTFIFIHLNKRL